MNELTQDLQRVYVVLYGLWAPREHPDSTPAGQAENADPVTVGDVRRAREAMHRVADALAVTSRTEPKP